MCDWGAVAAIALLSCDLVSVGKSSGKVTTSRASCSDFSHLWTLNSGFQSSGKPWEPFRTDKLLLVNADVMDALVALPDL